MYSSQIAIDLGSHTAKILHAEKRRKKLVISKFEQIPLLRGIVENGWLRDPKSCEEILQDPSLRWSKQSLFFGYSGGETTATEVSLPPLTDKEISHHIAAIAPQYAQMRDQELLVDYVPYFADSSEKKMILFTSAKEEVGKYLRLFQSLGFKRLNAQPLFFSLFHLLQKTNHDTHGSLLLNIGASSSQFLLIQDNNLIMAQQFPMGGNQITSLISQQLNLQWKEAELLKLSVGDQKDLPEGAYDLCVQGIRELLTGYHNYLTSLLARFPSVQVQKVLISGGGVLIPPFLNLAQEIFSLPTTFFDPLEQLDIECHIEDSAREELKRKGQVALGLIMRNLLS